MEPTENQTLLKQLDSCPPFVCYYAAHRGMEKRPKVNELAKLAGMPWRTFVRISQRTSWQNVTVNQMSRFCHGCGVDPIDPKPVLEWMAARMASGQLERDFNGPRGQGAKMLARLNLLSAKAVMR